MADVPQPGSNRELTALARHGVDAAADRRTKQGYLRWLPSRGRIVDVGCGTGSFLDVARDAGLHAFGIDRDVDSARQRGHEVQAGDALETLRRLAADRATFDGAVFAHVIEHHAGAAALELLQAIGAVLAPRAPLVVVTPNCKNHIVLSELFWLDATHVRPYPRALIESLLTANAFEVIASFDDDTTHPVRSPWRAGIARLRSLLSGVDKSGPLDAVVVARRR